MEKTPEIPDGEFLDVFCLLHCSYLALATCFATVLIGTFDRVVALS